MQFNTESYGAGFDLENMDSGSSPVIAPIPDDFTSGTGVVMGDTWRNMRQIDRKASIDDAFTMIVEEAEKDKNRKIPWKPLGKEGKTEASLFHSDGSWTSQGKEWLGQQRTFLEAAAEDESGGFGYNAMSEQIEIAPYLSHLLERQQKQFDPFSDLQNWMSEKNAVATEDETASLAWEDFVSYANSDVKSDEAKIDPENKELKKQWSQRMARELYTPETLGEEVMMQKVGGQWVLNSMNYSEIDKMENAINSNEELSLADKKILLGDYRSQVEANAGKIVNAFATADAGVIGSMFSRPLSDEFAEEMSKPGASAYEFIKARKDRFSKDSYGVTSEIAGTLRDAVMATGTGALWLASFGNYTSPAEAFGGLAEDTAKAYSDTTQFSAFGIDVSRRDLTQLTGQVGSFVVMGGMRALSGKLLTRAGAVGASRYAVGEGGKLVLKSSTAKAASLAATKDVLKAGGNLPKVSIPAKMGGWLKDAATDPELYIGSLQAAGMGFGSAFNEAYERTGSRDEALKAANIEGISGGIAVMIATGVMNRVAPGMGKALGMGDEGVGTSLIQNLRNRVVHKEGMEATQKSLEHLAGDAGAGLRKQFAKDIAQEMNDAARQLGLKGVGVLGNIGAEAVEESADAIISDSISAMLDHSKTWNEEVWGNIGTKWKEYVKAGVLGAIGGGMGASIGTATNAPQVFGKSDALNAMSDTWKAIETNIGNLGNDSLKMDVGGKAMSVSEMLSTELDPNQKIDIEKKSAMLVRAARGIGVYQAMPSSLVPTASQTAPTDTSGTSSLDATQAPPEDSQRAYPQGSLGQVMQSVGEEAPAGREWSRDSKAVEGSETSYKNKTGNFTLTPIHAVNDVSGKRNDNVAFKMVPFTSRLGKKTEGKPEYLTPAQAQSKLKEIGKNKEAAKLDRIVNATPEEKAQQYDEWTNETNKQSTTVDANNIQVTPPGEKGPRDSAPPQDDSDIGITGDGGPESTRQPTIGAPSPATIKPKQGDKLTYTPSDGSVSSEVEFLGYDDSSFDLSGKAKMAFVMIGDKRKTVQTSSLSLVQAKTETPAPAPKEKSQVSKFDRNESFESQVERTKDLKEGDEVAVLIDGKESIVKATIVETPKNGENGGYRSGQIAVRVIDSSGKVSEVKSSIPRWAVRKISKEPASTTAAVRAEKVKQLDEIGAAEEVLDWTEEDFDKNWKGMPPSFVKKVKAIVFGEKASEPISQAKAETPTPEPALVETKKEETEEGVKSFKGFEEIIANEAGANPLSALLLSLAMLAKARRNNGSTKKDVAAEVERLISESNLSDEQKNAARSRIGLAIEQTTWEESKPQSTKSDEKQTENKTEAEGLQVEEDQAEEEVVESPKTPEQKIAERLERDGIASTPELIASEYAKTEAGNPNNRISNTIKAIQKLSEEGHVPMRAASVADAPDITDGLDPDSTYIVEAATLDGGTDAAGAKWTRKSSENGKERYGYMPPKGMASTMGVGDTVVIAGNDKQVLMLKKVVDGELIFEALNIDFDAANQNALNEQLRKTSARYTRSILDRSIKSIVPMMSRFSDGSITLAEVETIFKDLLSIVAPRNNFKVVERKIDGDGYIFAEPAEKSSKKPSSIVVDYEKLKAELVKLYSNSDKGNQFAQELLAYDAAALITTVLSEEGIHIVTYGTFTRSELLSYYDNLWDLNDAFRSEQEAKGVAEGKIKDHPLFEELKKVAAERGVTKSLDPNSEKGATEKQRQEIAGELMRKFVQMALSGTTTERQSQLSKMLQRAMILDESNAREKKGFVKYLKAIGHMVRRYAERMRTILWINTQRGMLPSNLQEPLNRLIEATKKSGLTVDVLNAHSDTIAERTKMEELYNKSLESELQIIARNNSFPMRQLRNFLAASNRINIDIAIVHDPETMEIGLHPTLRELLENQKGENKIDMKALDDQFDRLNGKGGYSEDQTPAMKKIRTGVFLKWQKLQLLRDALPAQFSDMDLWTGAMKPDREGITRIDREKLFSDLFLDLEGKVSRSYASEVNKLIQQFKVSGYAENRKEIKIAHEKLDTYLIGRIKGLDLAKTKDMRRLFEWSQMIKLDPEDIVTSGINADVDSTPEELALALEKNRNRLLQILPMWSQLIHEARDKAPFGKHLRGKLKTLFDDYASLSNELDQNIQWQRQTYNDNLKKINELSDSTETSKDSDFVKVGEFTRAVDDYNHALKTAKNRAIGEFGLRTVGFGTAIKVQAINPESENPNSYSSLPPVDTGMDDLLDVVQDVGYSNIFPYEHQNGYDNSNADAPYSYSSRFIYPQRQESAVGQTESDGLAIGLDPNSKWERPGDEGLTPAEREWNAGLERYRHTTESNFMASGRNAFADFFVAENIGEIRNVDMIEAYAQTAGFSFDKTTNPDDDSVRYDSLLEAMPIFDHQKLNRLVGGLRRLKRGLRSDNNQDPTKVIADLFSYLEEMRQWSTKIRSLYQGSGFMPRIGRMQTLAGRSLPIFDQAFSNETDNGTLTNGLDLQIRRMHEALMLKAMEYVEVKNISMDKAYLKSADTLVLNNGLPVLKAGVDKKKLTDLAENLLKVVGEGNQKVMFDRSLYEAVQSVNLVRKQTKAFMDRKWRSNVEKEGSRTVTDPAYIPEYEQLTKLRNGALSPRTLKNLSFAMKYFEKERDYQFSANFGFEMLADFDKLSFGEGYESYVYTEAKAYDVYLSDSEAALVTTKEDATLTHPNVPEYSELKQDKDGRYFYRKQFQSPNYNEIVVSPQQAGFDDPRSRPFLTGEESPLLEGMNEVKSGGVSSQRETAQRRATSLQTARERNVALWSMLIGSNTTTGRSATAGRIFYFDLMQADEDGFVTVDEVLEDRRRMQTAPKYKRKQTLSRRVDGSPFETTDDTYIEEEFETMEEFSEDELSAMNETQLKNYFKVMRDKSLLERGLVGIFPNINPARKEFFDEIRNGFLEKYGSKNGYNFTSSERFLHDLASFKADFERDMIDRAIVKDKGVAAMALGTILEYVDVEVLAGDDAAVQFKNKAKNKPILTKGNNTFASPEEARNIWALAHSELMKPENSRQVVDVSKVAFLNSTVGPIIEQFLLTLDGNTIAVMPDEATVAKHQLSDTGIRIFEGGNGNPNVIYVPQASSMRDKRMVDEASMVIAHALSINARKNPSIVDMVNDLAGKVNAALDPIVRAESIESQISPVGKWSKKTVDISEAKEAIEANFQRILEGSPVEFTEKQQVRIRELVKAQFIKSIELARELEVGELTADQIALFGGDATFAANVLLVGTIFSNSKAKQFFDQAYFAIESFKPSSLPAMVGDSLINAVMDIARSGEVENGGVDPDWIGESSKVEQSDANQEAIQTFEESEQDRADRIADANAKYQADVDGIEIDEEDQTRTDAIYSVTSGFSDKVKSEIVGMVRANGGEAYFNGKSVFYSDADIVLINSLNSMIASAMKAREGVQPLKPSRDAREMLKEPGYLRDESEIKASELAQPVVAPIGWKDRAGKIYVGEARNLGRPSLPGNRTSLTQGFADKRISNMNANVLQLSPYIQKWIKLRAEESIRQSLEKTRIDAANNKSSLDYSQLKRFKTIDLEIEMSDEIIEELRSILPTGYMDQAEQEVRDEIARLEESVSKMTAAQAKKYQEYAGALFQGVSFPRKDVTKEVSDMMGYSQRFAQRLADILQENVLFEEGKVDQVAKGMSSFVRRQFKNDPLFKAAFNQMATLLDTINRELSVRHVFQEQNEDTVLIESGANPFRTLISSEENETRIGDLIRSYNSNVDVVNLVLDSMAKQGMALIGVDGSTKGYRLPYILGNPESISPQDLISLRRRSFGVDSTAKFKGQLMQHAERTIAAAFSDSIAKELAGAEGKTKMKSIPVGKDTRRNAQVKNFIKIVRQRMEEGRDLDNFDLASEITTALDMMTERLKSDPNGKNFSEYIKSIYLSFAEEDALYDRSLVTDDPSYVNKGQTAEQRDLVNKLEIQLDVISRGLAANQAALDLIDHSDYKQSIGKTYHRGIVGVPAVGQGDKQVLAGIEPMTREAGVNITLVSKGLGLTESGMAARQLWTGDQPSMDEASSAALKAQRRAFYAQKEAVVRALSEFAEERLEAVYRSERNTEENFVEFDPLGTIQKSVELAKVEMTLLDDYFSQAKTEAEKANYRGMMDNAVAILTDPKNPKRYNLLKRSQKNTVNLIRLPQNFEERLERIGMYHSEGGMSMILMPTTAADEMSRAFSGVTKKNVNSEIAHVAMAAQSLSGNQAQGTQSPSYFFEEVNKDTDAEFKSIGKLNQSTKKREGWRLAKQGMTRAQVADAFANEFENRIAKWLEDTRNRFSNGRKKTISMDGRITKAAMFQAKSLIRQIVLAYSSGKLEGNRYITVNSEVEKFMSMIDDIDTDTMGENGMPRSFTFKIEDAGKLITESMQLFKIEKTFSLVFSALEADLIAKRMVSGMTVSDSNTDLTMMRLAHHHDARIRSRFRKSLSAKQAVRHLVGILDHGFDGVSGREGYETSRRIAKEEIGEAARKVGSSAKNHAIGYLLAQIRGIKDAHGMSLSHAYTTWATQQNFGHRQSQDFVTAQEKKYGKNKVSKYWNGGHLDLVRDQPLAAEIDLIMRKATSVISIKSNDPLAEQKAEKAITDLEAALINAIEDNKKSEVDAYAKTLSSVFSDIDAAMHLSLALSSKKGRDVDALDEKTKWKHADIQAFKPTATNVPMRLGYAKDPAARKQGREGRYVSDPIEIVAMDEAAFFGGIAKGEPFERNRVYRPVMVNGLSTPLSIVDDAIYRLNVTPSYEVLRHSIGKVRAPHGPIEITDSDMEDALRSFNENSDQFETIREANVRNNERYRWMKDANTAFAAVAYELETIVQNDSAIGTAQTGGAETLRFLSAMYIMRALASPLQWWDQSVSPSFGYTVGKLVASKPKSVGLYFSTLSKMLTSSKFRNQIKDFIQETSPYVYYRASDGQDVAEDMIRGQERYGVGQVKAKIGRGFRAYERFAEKALSFTIGTPERMLAGTIYMVELAEKMKAETVQDVLLRKNEITKELAQQAKLKVNDVMAQSDQSKKSWFFQTRDQSPVLNAFWRSLVRFSNHTASMSSNTAVLTQTMFTDQEKGMSEMDDYYVSQKDAEESRREAMENIATTLTQNILFYPMKLKMLLPAVLYIIFKAGDDDDDEAALRAQRVTNEMIAPDENSNVIHRTIMALIFGKDRPLFQDRGTVDEAQASAFAEMLNYTAQEAITTIPLIGVAFGYSPVRGLIDKAFTNPGSEEAAALLMDVERDSVNIRQYRPGFIEGTAEFTTPTGTAYDYAAAAKLLLDYNMTNQASDNRAVSLRDSLLYLMSESLPGTREARSFMQDKLSEPVNDEKR